MLELSHYGTGWGGVSQTSRLRDGDELDSWWAGQRGDMDQLCRASQRSRVPEQLPI